ncbi:At1g47710 [Linum grandiflorum]
MDFSIRVAIETILEELGDDFGAAKNAVMSPASLDIVLRMVTCGAKGPTLDELLSFLGAPNVEQLNSEASATMSALSLPAPMSENNSPTAIVSHANAAPTENNRRSLKRKPAAIVSHANAVWVDQNYSLRESFKKMVREVYQADTNTADFKSQVRLFRKRPL